MTVSLSEILLVNNNSGNPHPNVGECHHQIKLLTVLFMLSVVLINFVVGVAGFEPTTSTSRT